MADPPSKHMTVPLSGFSITDPNTRWAKDLAACVHCVGCRPEVETMVSSTATCASCGKQGRLLDCAACLDAQYCSTDCQRSDWKFHKLMCTKLASYSADLRPSTRHFRVIVFPHEAAQPEFAWAFVNDKTELVIKHPSIEGWKKKMKDRYATSVKDPLIVHALSRDRAMVGKMLGHAVRVASWQPPNGLAGHLEGFNETILSLTGRIIRRSYGPAVAFAYQLDAEFNYKNMEDMSTKDFRHLVDFFNNSDWNPAIGDAERYPGKTIAALFIPDPFVPDTDKRPGLSICHVLGTYNPVLEVTIAAGIDFKQVCPHYMCDEGVWPIKLFCPRGLKWNAFLLGPLLLELPWIARNAVLTDTHNQGSRSSLHPGRISASYARFLNRGVTLGYRSITIAQYLISDGMLVYDAFCNKIHRLYLLAYDEFMLRQSKAKFDDRDISKKNFVKFWNDLKTGKEKIENQHKDNQHLDFSDAPSPYNDIDNAKLMLFGSASRHFLNLMKLLQNEVFRTVYKKYLNSDLFMDGAYETHWDLLPNFWPAVKNDKSEDDSSMKYPITENDQEKESEVATDARASDSGNLDLAELAAASLNVIQQ
ncbi:uncharacterized protein BKA55DRAFT_542830 [Fusarium redolens]|uniref:MYND-type domain-containing protein n=1 Tax=Fusarium redolens TaxID=48865 RepID=A0A9P9GKL4_FUSRE|nr:uncharacterized protein BKA55DRAFT_542830 [Fusarium redolens]KAH7240242.1 hypothetical protein BKA55DRAFT_542830 [Fusarium redolens]